MNVAKLFEDTVLRLPENTAVVFKGKKYSYRELNQETNILATGLQKIGLKKGDTLAILLPNSPLGITLFYTGLKLGAVTVCLNPMLKGQELKAVLADSKAKVFLTNQDCYKTIRDNGNGPNFEGRVVLVDMPESADNLLSLQELMDGGSEVFSAIDLDPDETAAIIYTSGTTGVPKGAVFTHKGLLKAIESLNFLFGEISPADKILNVAPLSSSISIATVMISAFIQGAAVYLHERFNPTEYVREIVEHKISIIFAVPTIYFALNEIPGWRKKDLQSLRFIGCSGAALPMDIRKNFENRTHKAITQFYGMTEATRILFADQIKGARRFASTGRALPDVEVKILGPEGQELMSGETGEVCTRFQGGMIGYWNKPAETEDVLQNGWLHTGDIGKLDKDGFLYLLDRKSDMIIVGGYNVYPAEIENVLSSDHRVKEAAVIGTADERLGEIPVAFVVLRKGKKATGKELIELTRDQLAKYKAPRVIRFVDHIPKNPIGKVLKQVLREQLSSEKL